MTLRVVRLGSKRAPREGTRIGTVRRPPRGVAKGRQSELDWFDIWLPNLAPSAQLVKEGRQAATPAQWAKFARKYRVEMASPENRHLLELLAVLSIGANFSIGCYCNDEARCHRSILRDLLAEHGAKIAQ